MRHCYLVYVLLSVLFTPLAHAKAKDVGLLPCVREVSMTEFTRARVYMMPFRGVNLLFPMKLHKDTATLALSTSLLIQYTAPEGSRLVPLTFKTYQGNEKGEIIDFSIITQDNYVFSIEVVVTDDPTWHCTNVVFTLSDKERKKLEARERENHHKALQAEYDRRFAELDAKAHKIALKRIGELAFVKPKTTNIYESGKLKRTGSGIIKGYVDKLYQYNEFAVLLVELENNLAQDLTLKSVLTGHTQGRDGSLRSIQGHWEYTKTMAPKSSQLLTFTTLESLPTTGGAFRIDTNAGRMTISW